MLGGRAYLRILSMYKNVLATKKPHDDILQLSINGGRTLSTFVIDMKLHSDN